MLRIANLTGVFTGDGFVRKQGRRPTAEDCGFRSGPIDILCDPDRGTIVAVGPAVANPAAAKEDVLDGSGLFATAGFVDPHTHAIYAGTRADEHFRRWGGATYQEIAAAGGGIHRTVRAARAATDEALVESLNQRLDQMLAHGSTVVEVKSGYGGGAEGELRLLRLLRQVCEQRTAPVVTATFLGLHALPPGVGEEEHVDAMVALLPAVVAEGLADCVDAFPERGFFSLASAERFARAALACGLRVKAHADQLSDLGSTACFVGLGAVSVDHLERVSPEGVGALARSDTVAVLLPAASFYLGMAYPDARRLLDAGARVALATDFNPGSAPALDLQFAMLLAAAGLKMTAAEILCAVTYNGAAAVGMGDTHGALLPGRRANLALWETETVHGEPVGLVEELIVEERLPCVVVPGGRVVHRDARHEAMAPS